MPGDIPIEILKGLRDSIGIIAILNDTKQNFLKESDGVSGQVC